MGTQGWAPGGEQPNESEGMDRLIISLPGMQLELLQRLRAANPSTPLVVVLMSGGALACPWCDEHADAVLWTGFNGQFAGSGLFDVLSGRVNPGGRMPYTVPKDVSQLPVITNYAYRCGTRNHGFWTKNDGSCTENDEFCTQLK